MKIFHPCVQFFLFSDKIETLNFNFDGGFDGLARAQLRNVVRRRLVLKNDHKNLTGSINHNIELLHLSKVVSKPSNLPAAEQVGLGHATGEVDMITDIPFAMVDEIAEAFPVAEDGLHLGDQVLKFGTIESGDNLLAQLASEVQQNQGCAIPVVLLRQGARMNLTVTPRTWSGRGSLGCHFRIL